jgi:glycosyltransferase involved in cell wall biosynthesis
MHRGGPLLCCASLMPRAILLDLTPLATGSTFRGIGRYVRGLSEGLAEVGEQGDLEVRGLVADPRVSRLELIESVHAYTRAPPIVPRRTSLGRRNGLIRFGAARLAQSCAGLLHFTDPVGLPWSGRAGHCLTCHDLIPIIMREYSSRIPGALSAKIAFERLRYRRARRILAVSHATKRDLCERLQIAPSVIDVVWHGVDHRVFHPEPQPGELERVQALLGTTEPYVLYVGAGDPRKDLDTLLKAFAVSRLRLDASLAIAGQLGHKRVASLRKLAKQLGVTERVKLLGYVAEELIAPLYRHATVHVFASRYEGFGFPVVEALAAGCPTITSPNSSLDEVAGDGALIVPCGEPEALAVALETLCSDTDKRRELRQRGLAQASKFTWKACATETLAFWRRTLHESNGS